MKRRIEEQARKEMLYKTQLTISSFGCEVLKTFVTYTTVELFFVESNKLRWVLAVVLVFKRLYVGWPISVELATIAEISTFTFPDIVILHV